VGAFDVRAGLEKCRTPTAKVVRGERKWNVQQRPPNLTIGAFVGFKGKKGWEEGQSTGGGRPGLWLSECGPGASCRQGDAGGKKAGAGGLREDRDRRKEPQEQKANRSVELYPAY